MKKIVQNFLLCSIVLALSVTQGRSQSKLVHYWNFNTYSAVEHTDTIHAIPADYTTVTSRTASILYAEIPGTSSSFSSYIDGYPTIPTDYDTINLRLGDTAGISLRPRNPTDSMQLLFYIPTTNYKNIVLTYATYSSSVGSGPLHQVFDYSLDSGATWKTTGLSITTDSAWVSSFNRVSLNFYGDTLVNNNSKLIFRLKFVGNNSGSSGNNRFDNVTIDADTITAATIYTGSSTSVGTVTANNETYTLYPNPVTDHVTLLSASDENKTIMIYNALGQSVFAGLEGGKQVSVSTANLSAGNYYMVIRGNNTHTTQTLKFVKQ